MLKLVEEDKLLKPFAGIIEKRHQQVLAMEREFTYRTTRLSDSCNSYLYYGLHRTNEGWVFREWAPNATAIYLLGEFNDWRKHPDYALTKVGDGNWEIKLPLGALAHEMLYRLLVEWNGGSGERLPSHVRRVIQDEYTKIYSAQVWDPLNPYQMRHERPKRTDYPLIYEAHIGMSTEHRRVSTFTEFRLFVLPRIVDLGYNTIQLMAVQEHPYYGSFGYQVANFFAVSSRFGTPDELKALIDAAHSMGIRVIMDIVHSHAVNNEEEGLSRFDGSYDQYFYPGERGYHPLWGSRCFDYGKHEVLNFLLSNCKYWLEEFRFDGYRFDGITSMLYWDHGINKDFTEYSLYYDGNQDESAITYLALANRVIHQVDPEAITIAEDMSGMPGVASPLEYGGMGFDYRMNMGTPDYWIKLLKEKRDEEWHVGDLFYELTNKREEEHTISYAESHDQALVGDKTIIFRLIDADMYWHMQKGDENYTVNRGIALHKMIRMLTATTINGGYLNFMGNEFGHPEWIDFPREGNGWSCKYARRQWDLVDNKNLTYHYMADFDESMLKVIKTVKDFQATPIQEIWHNDGDQILAYQRKDLIFVFNFNPKQSFTDYGFLVAPGAYEVILNTDDVLYGGNGLTDDTIIHFTISDPLYEKEKKEWLKLYIPARTAMVLRKKK